MKKGRKIGIKYCGGCNPKYDRKAAVDRLAKKNPEDCTEPVKSGEKYDMIVLVCGCQRGCIRNYREIPADEYLFMTSEKDFERSKEENGISNNNRNVQKGI